MTPELEALARRAVACPRWRWMPGMLWSIGPEPGWLRASTGRVLSTYEDGGPVFAPRSCLPDLTDPATIGCLLALVREAWNVKLCPIYFAGKYFIDLPTGEVFCQMTETEALVAALEAAP